MCKKIVLNPEILSCDHARLTQAQDIALAKAIRRIAEGNTRLEDIAPMNNPDMRESGCKRWKPSAERRALDLDEVRCVYRETEDTIEVIAVGARAQDAVYRTAHKRWVNLRGSSHA